MTRRADHETETDRLADAFLKRSLPKESWTHEAHLRVGLWHVLRHGEADALNLLRERISAFNAFHGGENTDTQGYHETITRFYVAIIASFVRRHGRERPLDELADALVAQHGDRQLPFRYYSLDRLNSVAARRGWVEPDLRPID